MKKEKDFIVPFKGLSTGTHQYQFKIDNAFFESFEYFESEKGNLNIDVEIVKEPTLLDLHFQINGMVDLECDRCLGRYKNQIGGTFRLIIKFGENFVEESDEVIIIPQTESTIDLRQYIFEYINLLLPVKRVHQNEADCKQDMIEKLQDYTERKNDPRWDALKNIKLK